MEIFAGSVWGAFLLTTLAGLATAAGGGGGLFHPADNTRMLSVALGLSGGVMVYISFVELLAGANLSLREEFGGKTGAFLSMGAFFGGMLLAGIIDRACAGTGEPARNQVRRGDGQTESARLREAAPRRNPFCGRNRNSQVPGRAGRFRGEPERA